MQALFQPHILFFLARLNGAAVGCGGMALFADFAEVKRMYVREAVRGRGVAQALLARIETEARAAGLSSCAWRRENGRRRHCDFMDGPAFGPARHSATTRRCPGRPSRPASSWKSG
ncbi:GNAT family N-acetyltransferase [Bradyrhizobium sp.]|uniref:GNAT family N-acetyltransferase n=1 Tax=Bradyrhizobium sp. TaxID=376 RepID=UPI003419E570